MKIALFFLSAFFAATVAYAAETALTVTEITETSAAIPYENVDATNGNSAANRNGDVFFLIYNAGADTNVVTITAQNTSKDVAGWGTLTKSDNTVSLTAGQRKMVGPFRSRPWNDSSGNIILSYSGDSSSDIDIAALRIAGK